jgi:hypothetical protein
LLDLKEFLFIGEPKFDLSEVIDAKLVRFDILAFLYSLAVLAIQTLRNFHCPAQGPPIKFPRSRSSRATLSQIYFEIYRKIYLEIMKEIFFIAQIY